MNTPATNERMRFEITHNTDYHYEDPVSYLIQLLRLTPRSDAGQTVINWHIGAPTRLHAQIDAFGNHTHLLTLNQATKQLLIEVRGTVEVNEDASSNRRPAKNSRISPLIFTQATRYTTADAELNAFAQPFAQPNGMLSEDNALRLMQAVHERIQYVSGVTTVQTTAPQAFAQAQGVCQDQAHVFLAAARAIGIPARYVSGYLNTGDIGHLASHAWVDVYTDRHEWLSLDITHNCITDGRHCRLAIGRDYDSAAPVRGSRMGGGFEALNAYVHVSAQGDDPHVLWMQQQ